MLSRLVVGKSRLISLSSRSPSLLTVTRCMSAKDRQRERRMKFDAVKRQQTEVDTSLPNFSNLIRQLYRRAHPDLLRASDPLLADANDESMQTLNGIITTIKTYNEYPAQIHKNITFHLKSTADQKVEQVDLLIHTAGGDCKRQLTASFEEFFLRSGILINPREHDKDLFVWNKDYFPIEAREDEEEDDIQASEGR